MHFTLKKSLIQIKFTIRISGRNLKYNATITFAVLLQDLMPSSLVE